MKVILLKSFGKLGKEGNLVKVKDGYARNYLIPQGIALGATSGNLKKIEDIQSKQKKVDEKTKQTFLGLKEKIDKISLTMTAECKDNEELYGSITEAQILRLLLSEGVELKKGNLILDQAIEKLGVYNLKVRLHPEVEADLRVWVVKK